MTPVRPHQLPSDPEALEALYRQDPQSFRGLLGEASRADPDSLVLRVWRARLGYATPGHRAVQHPGPVTAIALSNNNRTVRLTMPSLKPCSNYQISAKLKFAGQAQPVPTTITGTIHVMGSR